VDATNTASQRVNKNSRQMMNVFVLCLDSTKQHNTSGIHNNHYSALLIFIFRGIRTKELKNSKQQHHTQTDGPSLSASRGYALLNIQINTIRIELVIC